MDPDRDLFERHDRGELGVVATAHALRSRALARRAWKAAWRAWLGTWGLVVLVALGAAGVWGVLAWVTWRM